MKAIVPEKEKQKLYDKVIAKDIEIIAMLGDSIENPNEFSFGMKYDDSIEAKYIFQLIKIFNTCALNTVNLYVKTSYKTFRKLKKANHSINFKKLNIFNKKNKYYFIGSSFFKNYNYNFFSKERFYNENLIEDIWNEYYEKKELEIDEV